MIDATQKATLSADELAVVLNLDRKTVYEAWRRGELDWAGGFRLGRRLLFSAAAVERFLRDGR